MPKTDYVNVRVPRNVYDQVKNLKEHHPLFKLGSVTMLVTHLLLSALDREEQHHG